MQYLRALESAILIKRYKRFLADVRLANGDSLTIYCPNTGSMKNCADPGVPIWFSRADNPKRRYQMTWEQGTDSWGNRVGLRSAFANNLVAEAIESGLLAESESITLQGGGQVPWLGSIKSVQSEWRWASERVRIDFALETQGGAVLVEVKSVTLSDEHGRGSFPDAKTARGLKQVKALQLAQKQGVRTLLVYCVQNSGVSCVSLADDIDPAYTDAVRTLCRAGGRVLAIGCDLSEMGISPVRPVPMLL
jgi:sugar fermentation stimulation protein A